MKSFPMPLQECEFEHLTLDRQGQVIARETGCGRQGTVDLGGGIALMLLAVPGGTFLMGSPEGHGFDDERPQHRVTVAPFFLGRHLVTQEQWAAVMGQPTPAAPPSPWLRPGFGPEAPRCRFQGTKRPVDNVSWDATQEFTRSRKRRENPI